MASCKPEGGAVRRWSSLFVLAEHNTLGNAVDWTSGAGATAFTCRLVDACVHDNLGQFEMPLVRLDDISVSYDERIILKDITEQIMPGQCIAVTGANGSGKSTLLRVVAGQQRSYRGSLTFSRKFKSGYFPVALAIAPSLLPTALSGTQAVELVAHALGTSRRRKAEEYAEEVGLTKLLSSRISSYSLGARQKLSIMLALLGDRDAIVLDESLNGLDAVSKIATLVFIKRLAAECGTSLMLATHDLEAAVAYVDRIWLLRDSRVARSWSTTNAWGGADVVQKVIGEVRRETRPV
ncbi:ATP-binding cassette domain-containing protein [Pinirhizobacter soli]|uniref:ATP-binding cassette domain-containing protein n=1 Tax=Pinirhizobacter soli TaxID=2786953 RepID=UPI003CCE063C